MDISPIFIGKPKDLWFGRVGMMPGKAWEGGPGDGRTAGRFDHRVGSRS